MVVTSPPSPVEDEHDCGRIPIPERPQWPAHTPWALDSGVPMRKTLGRACANECADTYELGWSGCDLIIRRTSREWGQVWVTQTPTPVDRDRVMGWWWDLLEGRSI